ncbi:MAG: rhamnulokinase, partial [Opitutales bacterium]
MNKVYLAIDFGAGSGRVIAGRFDGARLELEVIHRFPNEPITLPTGIYWGLAGLYQQAFNGLRMALARWPEGIVSAGVDSWGLDYAHMTSGGEMLGLPRCYRDPRTEGMMEKLWEAAPRSEIYRRTGIQAMRINPLVQLFSEAQARSPILAHSERLLLVADVINFFLTGRMVNERTLASTTQLYDPRSGDWDRELIGKVGLPPRIFGEIIDPGELVGRADIDGRALDIVAVGAHDTASAVAATPLRDKHAAYASSGTWTLIGLELPSPVLTAAAEEQNFTNEVGVSNTIRLLKNRTGMWLLQECKRHWEAEDGADIGYAELDAWAAACAPFPGFIDPDAESLLPPGDMPGRIREALRESGQPAPAGRGPIVRIILESLALKYRHSIEALEKAAGESIQQLHIVGGGAQNKTLNQFVANALGRPVIAGPVEATAIGNILVQMQADGAIDSIAAGRQLVRDSFPAERFEPAGTRPWRQAYERFLKTF